MSKAPIYFCDGCGKPHEYGRHEPSIDTKDYQPHREGLHSDDSPYPGEKMCYCDQPKPTPTALSSIADIVHQFGHWQSRNDSQPKKIIADLEAHIAEHYVPKAELLEARIEAYQHIWLSDNGMQEPLRSWLDGYITQLKKELKAKKEIMK